jgi:uroporphyrinogen-III synthase
MVITTPVYRMDPVDAANSQIGTLVHDSDVKSALFYSRRTAQVFVSAIKALQSTISAKSLAMLCLSENVAQPLIDAHFVRIGLADHPSEEAMLALALSFARDQNPA